MPVLAPAVRSAAEHADVYLELAFFHNGISVVGFQHIAELLQG